MGKHTQTIRRQQSGDEIGPLFCNAKNIFLSKYSMKNVTWELVLGPF